MTSQLRAKGWGPSFGVSQQSYWALTQSTCLPRTQEAKKDSSQGTRPRVRGWGCVRTLKLGGEIGKGDPTGDGVPQHSPPPLRQWAPTRWIFQPIPALHVFPFSLWLHVTLCIPPWDSNTSVMSADQESVAKHTPWGCWEFRCVPAGPAGGPGVGDLGLQRSWAGKRLWVQIGESGPLFHISEKSIESKVKHVFNQQKCMANWFLKDVLPDSWYQKGPEIKKQNKINKTKKSVRTEFWKSGVKWGQRTAK